MVGYSYGMEENRSKIANGRSVSQVRLVPEPLNRERSHHQDP
jgi:hypothetical protein